jgi:hypothetical protein
MHADMTPQEAVDTVASAAREIGAACAALASRVVPAALGTPGREAERVARTLEYEADQLTAALSTLRKFTRSEQADAVQRAKEMVT